MNFYFLSPNLQSYRISKTLIFIVCPVLIPCRHTQHCFFMSWLFLFVRAGLRIGISYSSIQTPAPTALLQWSESEVEKEAERNDKKNSQGMYTGQSGGAVWFSRTGRYRFSYLSFFFFFSSLFYISPSSSYSSFTSFFFSIRPSFLYSLRFPLAFLPFFVRLTFRGSLGVLCG